MIEHPGLASISSKRSRLFTMFLGQLVESQWKNVESLNLVGSLGPSTHANIIFEIFLFSHVGDQILKHPYTCCRDIAACGLFILFLINKYTISSFFRGKIIIYFLFKQSNQNKQ